MIKSRKNKINQIILLKNKKGQTINFFKLPINLIFSINVIARKLNKSFKETLLDLINLGLEVDKYLD